MGPEAIGTEGGEIYEPGKIKEMPDPEELYGED